VLVLATAITFWVLASRMRVVAEASPLNGVKLKVITSGARIAVGVGA
jgi:hypothetical protein